jgi:protein phosphatase
MREYTEETVHYHICAASDPGPVKRNNEDYFGIFRPESPSLLERKGLLIIVADGMGGLFRGERASRRMVDAIGEFYFDHHLGGEPAAELAEAFREGNRKVFEEVGEGKEVTAGTTCTAAALFPDCFHLVHVGDSRAYLVREGVISQLTEDHSREKRIAGPGMAGGPPRKREVRRIMTRSAGVKENVEADLKESVECRQGDRIILCSDGLFSVVPGSVIADESLSGAGCSGMIKRALEAGSMDNITAVIASRK